MMLIMPCTAPFLVGENVALIAHCAPGATRELHVDVIENSVLAFIDWILSSVVPLLMSVTVCATLVVPTVCSENSTASSARS